MAQRFIEGIGNHERRSQIIFNQFERRRPLGRIEAKFNTHQEKPILSMAIEPFDPLIGAIERNENSSFPASSHAKHYKRNMSAPAWNEPRNAGEMRNLYDIGTPELRGFRERPRTVPAHSRLSKRGKSAQSRPVTSEALYRFKVDERIRQSHNGVRHFNRLIKEQFDPESRSYVKTGIYARGKSGGVNSVQDKRLQQWFSFEGESPGGLNAFTGGSVEEPVMKEEYNVESSAGKHVANVLVKGDAVRVYKNGRNITTSAGMSDHDKFHRKCDEALELTRTNNTGKISTTPFILPLCMEDAATTYKVLPVGVEKQVPEYEDLNETNQVKFNQISKPKPYQHPDSHTDGYAVQKVLKQRRGMDGSSRPMTAMSIGKAEDPEASMVTYEALLMLKAPEASSMAPSINQTPMPSPDPHAHLSVTRESTPKAKGMRKPFTLLLNPDPEPIRVKTPTVPDEVKSHIHRQCSMPSYSVLAETQDEKTGENKVVVIERTVDTAERTCTPARPPLYTPAYKEPGHESIPTISHNGVEGEKEFVKINMPLKHLLGNKSVHVARAGSSLKKLPNGHVSAAPGDPNWKPSSQIDPSQLASTITVHGVGSATVTNPEARAAKEYYKPMKPKSVEPSPSLISQKELTAANDTPLQQLHPVQLEQEVEKMFNVNIPMMETASRSSIGANSLTDFEDYDPNYDPEADIPTEDLVPLPSRKPPPGTESLEEMALRVQEELEKSTADNEKFLQALEVKRRKTRQVIEYSDDESTPRSGDAKKFPPTTSASQSGTTHDIPYGKTE